MEGVYWLWNNKNKESFIIINFSIDDCSGVIDGEFRNWGHVGLYIGNGEIIHAWDKVRIDNYLDVEKLEPASGWDKSKFIGWVPLERILVGAQRKIYE